MCRLMYLNKAAKLYLNKPFKYVFKKTQDPHQCTIKIKMYQLPLSKIDIKKKNVITAQSIQNKLCK